MRTLIINCHLIKSQSRVISYVSWVKEFSEVDIVSDENVDENFNVDSYDAILITGSRKFASKNEFCKGIIRFIKKNTKPMIGICYGHQLICKVLGCEVIHKPKQIKGEVTIEIIDENELFRGLGKKVSFVESHFDHVVFNKKLFNKLGLSLLARSNRCEVEAIKWLKAPLYGVQFHPEVSGKNGKKIAENFYKYVVRK